MHSMFMIKNKQTIHALNACHEEDFTLQRKDEFYFLRDASIFNVFPYIAWAFVYDIFQSEDQENGTFSVTLTNSLDFSGPHHPNKGDYCFFNMFFISRIYGIL